MQPQNKETTPVFQVLTEEECAAVRSIPEDRGFSMPCFGDILMDAIFNFSIDGTAVARRGSTQYPII